MQVVCAVWHKQPTNIVTNKDLPKFFNFRDTYGHRILPMGNFNSEGFLEFPLIENRITRTLHIRGIILRPAWYHIAFPSGHGAYFLSELIP